jgi:phage tail-like protein
LGRDEGELRNLLLCMQEVGELLLYEADAFPNVLDPDTAPEAFVDAMLSDLGNPFGFTLSTIDKRRLAQTLRRMYGQKGTDVGIINAIRFFLGIEVTIERVRASGAHLGVDSTLGQEFTLASGALADFYTFIVHVSQTIDDETEARIDEIVAFMRRAPCHWRIEAPSMIDDPDHWQLGFSRLGVTTELHE